MGTLKIPNAKDTWLEEIGEAIAAIREVSKTEVEFMQKTALAGIEITYPKTFLESYWYRYQQEEMQ